MSWEIIKLVRKRKIGSPTKKSILLHLAAIAKDDGTEIYQAKSNIARVLELGRRTVQENMEAMELHGLIKRVSKRKSPNGYVHEYRIDLEVLGSLPSIPLSNFGSAAATEDVRVAHSDCAGPAHLQARGPHTTNSERKRNNRRAPRPKGKSVSKKCNEEPSRDDVELEVLRMTAKRISNGEYVPQSTLSPSQVRKILQLGLVTEDQLRSAGIVY